MPVGAPFQIKFMLPDDTEDKCSNFVVSRLRFKSLWIMWLSFWSVTLLLTHTETTSWKEDQWYSTAPYSTDCTLCQCQFSSSYITDSQMFCTVKDAVIYQAQLLPTDNKTAFEIRNTTQLWILSKPVLVIEQRPYQVDPYCSVVVKELGTTTCDTTEALSTSRPAVSTIELVSVIGTGVMLILVITLIIILVVCCWSNKVRDNYYYKLVHHSII